MCSRRTAAFSDRCSSRTASRCTRCAAIRSGASSAMTSTCSRSCGCAWIPRWSLALPIPEASNVAAVLLARAAAVGGAGRGLRAEVRRHAVARLATLGELLVHGGRLRCRSAAGRERLHDHSVLERPVADADFLALGEQARALRTLAVHVDLAALDRGRGE